MKLEPAFFRCIALKANGDVARKGTSYRSFLFVSQTLTSVLCLPIGLSVKFICGFFVGLICMRTANVTGSSLLLDIMLLLLPNHKFAWALFRHC
jgi:hypothetical protein